MRIILSLALLASVSLAAPATAQTQPEAAKPAKPKRICRVDPTTGSVMPRYVCHSKEEWNAIDKVARDASENGQNGLGTMNSGSRNGSVGS